MTAIEWTDATWNPVVGCSRVSAGCQNCYAERVAHRGMAAAHRGLTRLSSRGPQWTGEVRFLPEKLAEPLRWKKPRRVFVNSMSDLFHESLTNEQIAAVFGVMASCPHHTFQVLTKRPRRMVQWFEWSAREHGLDHAVGRWVGEAFMSIAGGDGFRFLDLLREHWDSKCKPGEDTRHLWPLPNVWLGVSCENQAAADERVPPLLQTPAAVRFVSAEPLLGRIDFTHLDADRAGNPQLCQVDGLTGRHRDMGRPCAPTSRLDWVIVGGESGPDARRCDVAWVRSIVEQCRQASVACFVKQLGARSTYRVDSEMGRELPSIQYPYRDRKGGDPSEWPDDLRVREFPPTPA